MTYFLPSFRPSLTALALGLLVLVGTGCAGITPPGATVHLDASLAASLAPTAFEHFEWPADQRIRSAGRLRDLGLSHEGGADPEVERARLQSHFVAVLELLKAQEIESLATAVARWEAQSGVALSPRDRNLRYEALREARTRQVHVLADYAARGRFPLNPNTGGQTEPIFVDADDTACAVGYLMRVDGYGEAVEAIRQDDLFVYVPDVHEGELVAWVLESGLLQEEAALIQPAYTPPPPSFPGVDLAALSAPGAFIETDGLRIEAFGGRATTFDLPNGITLEFLELAFPNLTPQEALDQLGLGGTFSETPYGAADWAEITLHSGFDYITPNGGEITSRFDTSPISSPWLFWNAGTAGGFLAEVASPGYGSGFELNFDVSATTAGYGINGSFFQIAGAFWGGAPTFGEDLQIDVLIQSVSGELLASYSELGGDPSPGPSPGTNFSSENSFEVQEKVRVTVRGSQSFADQAVVWSQFRQDFQIVPIPEPGVGLLLGFGLLSLSLRRPTR